MWHWHHLNLRERHHLRYFYVEDIICRDSFKQSIFEKMTSEKKVHLDENIGSCNKDFCFADIFEITGLAKR